MIIGTCGNCGGPVETDMEGVGYCRRCGSQVKNPYGRVIPMNPRPTPWSFKKDNFFNSEKN